MKVRVKEIFYSISGEGISQGNPTVFVRLFGCNLHCGYDKHTKKRNPIFWECDSTNAWLYGKEDTRVYDSPEALLIDIEHTVPRKVDKDRVDIIFTGGEPLLYIDNSFLDLLDSLHDLFATIYFETNGTIDIDKFKHTLQYVKFNCSPKTLSSGVDIHDRFKPECLRKISKIKGSCFKFVMDSVHDQSEILLIILSASLPLDMIYIMPEGQTRKEIEQKLLVCSSFAKKHGFKISNRMQIQIWNKCMGV